MLDHFERRNFCRAITGVRSTLIGEFKYPVEFLGGKWNRRRSHPDFGVTVLLYQRSRIVRVGLFVQHSRGVSIQRGVFSDLVVAGNANYGQKILVFGVEQLYDLRLGIFAITGFLSHHFIGVWLNIDSTDNVDTGRIDDGIVG